MECSGIGTAHTKGYYPRQQYDPWQQYDPNMIHGNHSQAHVCMCVYILPQHRGSCGHSHCPHHMTLTWNMAALGSSPNESLKGWLYCSHILCGKERDGQASHSQQLAAGWYCTHTGSPSTPLYLSLVSLCVQRKGSEVNTSS